MFRRKYRGTIALASFNGVTEGVAKMLMAHIAAGILIGPRMVSRHVTYLQLGLALAWWLYNWIYTQLTEPASDMFPDRYERIWFFLGHVGWFILTCLAIGTAELWLCSAWHTHVIAGAVNFAVLIVLAAVVQPRVALWTRTERATEGLDPDHPCYGCPLVHQC